MCYPDFTIITKECLVFFGSLPRRVNSEETKWELLLSARTAMWSMPMVLTETENENDSANQNDVAKMTSQCRMETAVVLCTNPLIITLKSGKNSNNIKSQS